MTCEAEKQALAEILRQLQEAENDVQQEKALAEVGAAAVGRTYSRLARRAPRGDAYARVRYAACSG